MDDQNQSNYVNSFIDVTVSKLNTEIGTNLHLQTQLKMAEALVGVLNKQFTDALEEKNKEIQALNTKIKNLDGLVEQLVEMKKVIQSQKQEIDDLKSVKPSKKRKPTLLVEKIDVLTGTIDNQF